MVIFVFLNFNCFSCTFWFWRLVPFSRAAPHIYVLCILLYLSIPPSFSLKSTVGPTQISLTPSFLFLSSSWLSETLCLVRQHESETVSAILLSSSWLSETLCLVRQHESETVSAILLSSSWLSKALCLVQQHQSETVSAILLVSTSTAL